MSVYRTGTIYRATTRPAADLVIVEGNERPDGKHGPWIKIAHPGVEATPATVLWYDLNDMIREYGYVETKP